MEQNKVYVFGPYRLDTATKLLWNEASCVNLSPEGVVKTYCVVFTNF